MERSGRCFCSVDGSCQLLIQPPLQRKWTPRPTICFLCSFSWDLFFISINKGKRKEERNKNQEIRREEPNVFQIILAFNLTSFILICECLKGKELHGILRLYLSKPCVFTVSPIEWRFQVLVFFCHQPPCVSFSISLERRLNEQLARTIHGLISASNLYSRDQGSERLLQILEHFLAWIFCCSKRCQRMKKE